MEGKRKRSKREISLIACMFFVMLAFVISGVILARNYAATRRSGNQPVAVSQPVPDLAQTKKRYTLRLYRGNVAIFDDANPDMPLRTTDIAQATLRTYDKEQFERGVEVYGETALAMILEDFQS